MRHEYRSQIRVQWGECDAAEIIYYPNYFRWFDDCTQGLLRSVNLSQRHLRERYGLVGTAIVDASASFTAPLTFEDLLQTVSYVERWGTKSFTIYHRFDLDGKQAVEGREVRVWALKPGPDGALRAGTVPEEFKALFESV
jgi:YbgC/YbaW family acyl-CoA thioester hydrolase